MSDDTTKPSKQEIATVIACNDQHALIVSGTKEAPTGVELLTKVEEGRPVYGDLVHLHRREDGMYDVSRTVIPHSGPAQIATQKYRANYDRIFNKELN